MGIRTIALAGIVVLGGVAASAVSAYAGCCGGGNSAGSGFGRPFAQGYRSYSYAGRAGCCGMMTNGMAMTGATMPGMSMPGTAGPATAAPASTTYYCPMHPTVRTTYAAICPYCQMALTKQ